MLAFNPFGKPLDQLTAADLAVLRDVREGWFLDYKQELLSPKEIAKAVSSFANETGGWLLFGIEESEENTAYSFPGLPLSEVRSGLQRIRDAIAQHVDPPPYYEHRAINGPCDEIGLAADRAIIALVIPRGPLAPFVHSSGVIYRRIGDRADPRPVTDRAALDALFQRSSQSTGRLAERFNKRPELSEAEEGLPYLQLFIMSDPFGDKGHRARLRHDEFASIMSGTAGDISLTFDNIFAASDGYVARHVATTPQPSGLVLTWSYDLSGASTVTIPFNSRTVEDSRWDRLSRVYSHLDMFRTHARRAQLAKLEVIDANLLLGILLNILAKQALLMRKSHIEGPVQIKVRLGNLWRKTPFLDMEAYMEFIQRYGIPVIQSGVALLPFGDIPAMASVKLPAIEAVEGVKLVDFSSAALPVFAEIMAALGIPFGILRAAPTELIDAVNRGSTAHRGDIM